MTDPRTVEFLSDIAKQRARVAINDVYESNLASNEKLRVHSAPERCVSVTQNVRAGELKLAPLCTQMQVAKAGKATSAHAFDMGKINVKDDDGAELYMYIIPRTVMRKTDEEEALRAHGFDSKSTATFIVPLWLVNETPLKESANMELSTVRVGGVDVPILKNTSAVKAGTELLQYKAPTQKKRVFEGGDDAAAPKKGRGKGGKGRGKGK